MSPPPVDTADRGRICALCKNGIPWDVTFGDCTYCRLPFCKHCWLQHQPSHVLASVMMIHGDIHDPSNRNPVQPCAVCRMRTVSRYVCLDRHCTHTLCRSCWFSRGVNNHVHKTFKVVEARWRVRSNNASHGGESCCDTATLNHCSSCSTPLSLGQPISFCRTCFVETTEPMFRCQSCSAPGGDDHPTDHESWRWTFQVEKEKWLANGIYCRECAQPMRSLEDIKGHAHKDYIDVYTEENLNQVIARSYRECQRKVMRVDGLVARAREQCNLCLHKTKPIASLQCQQCNQSLKLCTHCLQYASNLHVHPIPRFLDGAANQVEQDQGRRMDAIPEPEEGAFRSSTLRTPRSASQSDAAAAHTTSPPLGQRVSGAPSQRRLLPRPQSSAPAPPRPQAQHVHQFQIQLQQQNSLEVSMANAAVAAAVNTIYGGGGGGSNGAGTPDTGTTGPDVAAGMDTEQDSWPDMWPDMWPDKWPETWQDTAVYDSEWALDDSGGFDPTF